MKTFAPTLPGVNRIPSLDGLRAISIALVIFSHALGTRHFLSGDIAHYTGDLGNLGVRMFFVISGFLITRLLLSELEQYGAISLNRFYLRRTLRIFPAFYACLGVIALLALAGVITLNRHDLLYAATYTINYRSAIERSWNVGHMWSLAVEEQFYLLWPAALVLLGRRKAFWSAALVICLIPLLRLGSWYYFPAQQPGMKWEFQYVCDALATGCVLAGIGEWLSRDARFGRLIASNAMIVLPLLAAATNWYMSGRPRLNYLAAQSFMNVALALFLWHCIGNPDRWAGRLLNMRLPVAVGVLSYSVYLWQQLFLDHHSTAWYTSFPTNVLLTLGMATLSFVLVERPCLAIRRRFETRLQPRERADTD